MKFIRIVLRYVLFFVVSLTIAGLLAGEINDLLLFLFAFGAPALLVWLFEVRRARRVQAIPASAKPDRQARRGKAKRNLPVQDSAPLPIPIKAASTTTGSKPLDRPNYSKIAQTARDIGPEMAEIADRKEASITAQPKVGDASRGAAMPPPIPTQRTAAPSVITPARHQGWLPKGQSISVQGRTLPGMIYVGTPPTTFDHGYREKLRAYIDPSLQVAREGNDIAGDGMDYWPSFSTIPPNSRATYLDWLANDAADSSYDPGYMFLYFYGLERRFFLDKPTRDEQRDLLDEVRRLRDVFRDNRSVARYLGDFIEVAVVSTTEVQHILPVFDAPGWDVPLSTQVAIGARLLRAEPLSADWLLSWFLNHPEKSLRTPANRCRDEYMALFKLRFDQRFSGGLKVNKPRKNLSVTYQAASGEFTGTIDPTVDGKPVPDISGLRKPIEIAQEITDAVMDDLEKFSRYLGRTSDGRGNVEAYALLPTELRQIYPSKELEEIKGWAAGIVQSGGLVPVGDVLARLEGSRPEKLGKRQLTGAADALARLGFGMAPDPRFALRSPTIDEPVVLFKLDGEVEQLEDVSTAYKAALLELALGSLIAHADGTLVEMEATSLEARAQITDGLSEQEQRRLSANLVWFRAVPPDMALLRRNLKDVGPDQQAAIRGALVAAAHADGIVKPAEVAEMEKIYRTLGLDPTLVYSDLHVGDTTDTPSKVRAAVPAAPGEPIPPQGPRLDAARIASIRQDTAQVSAVLAGIFVPEEEEPEDRVAPSSRIPGLDDLHAALVRSLITRTHWSEDDFAAQATHLGLMVAGALETINEWSFETYDEALLEDYNGYDVAADIAQKLTDAFGKET